MFPLIQPFWDYTVYKINSYHRYVFFIGYKYFGVYVISSPMLVVVDLELAKHVMTKDFSNFVDRGVYTNEKDDPLSMY